MVLNRRQDLTADETRKKLDQDSRFKYIKAKDIESGKRLYGFNARKAIAQGISKFSYTKDKMKALREKWGFKDKKSRNIVEALDDGQKMSETEVKSTINRVVKNMGDISEKKLGEIEKEVRAGKKSWSKIRKNLSNKLKGERARNIIASRYSSERVASRAHGEEAVKEALTKRVGNDKVKIDHTRIAQGQSYGISALSSDGGFTQDDFSSESKSSVNAGKPVTGVASGIGARIQENKIPPGGGTPKGTRPIGL